MIFGCVGSAGVIGLDLLGKGAEDLVPKASSRNLKPEGKTMVGMVIFCNSATSGRSSSSSSSHAVMRPLAGACVRLVF